jgi:choline kinase
MTRAIILAAGRGSRMGELTDDRPKCFTPVRGVRLLDLQLAALRGAGITDIAIVRGYSADSFTEPVHYFDNPRWASTNMVLSLATAAEWLSRHDCIVSYSDIFYSAETVRDLAGSAWQLALSYDPDWLDIWSKRFADPLSDAETFRRDEAGRLTEIGARASSLDEITGQGMGLLKFTPESWREVTALLAELGPDADRLDMTGLLRRGLAHDWTIGTIPVRGPWGEVDSADDLAAYEGAH